MTSYKNIVESSRHVVKKLAESSGMDEDLIRNIVKFSRCLCKKGHDSIDNEIFSVVLSNYFNITDQTALMKYFLKSALKRHDGEMDVEDFAKILCSFLTHDFDSKIDYVFDIYDINGDGYIDMTEVMTFTKSCKCVSDTDEVEKDETYYDLTYMAATVLGIGPDHPMDRDMFREKARENHLVLSILGEALPRSGDVARFRHLIEGKTNLQMIDMFGSVRHQLLHEVPDRRERKYYPITLDLP